MFNTPVYNKLVCVVLQVLQYMRSDLNVGGKNVLAVVLTEPCIKDTLTHSIEDIGKVISSGYGEKNIPKDFLMVGCKSALIKRGHSARKQKCCVLYMTKIDPELVKKIKKRECEIS